MAVSGAGIRRRFAMNKGRGLDWRVTEFHAKPQSFAKTQMYLLADNREALASLRFLASFRETLS